MVLKVWSGEPWGLPRVRTTFIKITRQHFPFISILPGVHRGVFQRPHKYMHRKQGADTRIQLSSIKPDKYLKHLSVLISNLKIPIDIIHINQSSWDSSISFKIIRGY